MHIALFANLNNETTQNVAEEALSFLKQKGCSLYGFGDCARAFSLPFAQDAALDCVICIGGDGTILRLFQELPGCSTPILGINSGHLGFLTQVPLDHLHTTLEAFLNGEYTIQERMTIKGTFGKTAFQAVNDIVIHRSSIPSLIDLSVYVDGEFLNTFCADGMIISTPSGSTAYSLSAGGPILSPELEALVITPICPHTISNRPIVLMPSQSITVEYCNYKQGVEITYDGHSPVKLNPGETLEIKKAKERFRMIKLKQFSYFNTLRTKLGWSGQVRYRHAPISVND